MPDLILHGGAPKTGTSFLQILFARYADRLRDSGIIYPRGHLFDEASGGAITSGNGVELANFIRPGLPHKILDKGSYLKKLEAELASSGDKHVFYSSEFLLAPPVEQTKAIVNAAARNGYRIRYIYLVRDLAPAFLSFYSQQVKRAGETRPFTEFITNWNAGYKSAIRQAIDSFGRENVEVYNYEEHRQRLADMFFRDVLGADFAPDENPVVNRSLTAQELVLLGRMNMVFGKNRKQSKFAADALTSVPVRNPEPLTVTPKEGEFLQAKFRGDLDYINQVVIGRPVSVGKLSERRETALSDFEESMAALMSHLVATVVR